MNKTDVKLLSIDKYVGNLLSNLAMNSFKPSSKAHKNQLEKKTQKTFCNQPVTVIFSEQGAKNQSNRCAEIEKNTD